MPDDPQQLLTIVSLAYVSAVAVVDLRSRRIPNGLTLVKTLREEVAKARAAR